MFIARAQGVGIATDDLTPDTVGLVKSLEGTLDLTQTQASVCDDTQKEIMRRYS
jgi:hypothetical protein